MTLLKIDLGHLPADHDGHKNVFAFKGASGLKACRKCSNVVSKDCYDRLELESAAETEFVAIWEHVFEKFKPCSDEELFQVAHHLADVKRRLPGELESHEGHNARQIVETASASEHSPS